MAKTKIVATIGPASTNPDLIRKMLHAGMNVARMNFSHGDHDWHRETVAMLRQVATEEGKILAILADLQGPKLRVGNIAPGGIQLSPGDEVLFTPYRGQPNMIQLPHPELFEAAQPGARFVFGDGEVEVRLADKRNEIMYCTVTVAGLLEARKGVNAPGTNLPMSSMTEKDRNDLPLICELDPDYVALSFVRNTNDVLELRELLTGLGKPHMPIIAKIEKSEAIEHLEKIRDVVNGMMVARGDLGIDMPPQEVPLLQKRIIRCCNDAGIPVITATQMLQSMVQHPRPTRAEASDVANAILDGTDAVMLSNETATGRYPVEAVRMMSEISEITEQAFPYDVWRQRRRHIPYCESDVTESISAACCDVAEQVRAKAIVTTTLSGYTARQIARHRPEIPIIAVSTSPQTQRQLAMVWGIRCLLTAGYHADTDDMLANTIQSVKSICLKEHDRVVITAGIPFGQSGQTNLIQVHEITTNESAGTV